MADKILQTRLVHALKPTSAWEATNTIPLKGEECLELCSNDRIKMKIGDGVHKFSELSYYIDTDIDIVVGSSTFHSDTLHNAFVLKEGSTNGTFNIGVGGSTADVTIHGLTSAAFLPVTTSVTNSSTNSELPTAKAVYDAIDALPEPMIFKGTVGTGGTTSTLPTASSANEGWTYKVITDGTYGGTSAKVGDTLISNAIEWVRVPSGDEPSGTVTSVGLTNATGESDFTITGSPITSSGTLTIKHANNITAGTAGTTSSQTPSAGTTFAIPYVTYDKHGHVTSASTASVKIPDAVSANDADMVIAVNGSSVGKFTGNQESASTVNLTGLVTTSNIGDNVGHIITTATTAGTPGTESVTNDIELHKVAKTGTYSDLIGTPTINDKDMTIAVNGSTVGKFTGNQSANSTVNLTGLVTTSTIGKLFATASTVSASPTTGELFTSTINLAKVVKSGSYNDLVNKPTIGNGTITVEVNGSSVGSFTVNQTSASSINIPLATTSNDGAMSTAQVEKLDSISSSANRTEWSQTLTSGTKIGTITIDGGTPTTVYAPSVGKIITNTSVAQSTSSGENTTASITLHRISKTGNYDHLLSRPVLDTTSTASLTTSASETITGTIQLHKVAKTGAYSDLVGAPSVNDGKLTINAGGSSAQEFTANQSSDALLNIVGEKGISVSTTASGEILVGHDTTGAGSITSASKTFVNGLTIDSFGHITAVTTGSVTDTDTKVTYKNTNSSTVSIYIGGSTSSSTSTTSAWRDTNIYLSGTATTYGILSTATTANQEYKTQTKRRLVGATISIDDVVYTESDTILVLDGNFY